MRRRDISTALFFFSVNHWDGDSQVGASLSTMHNDLHSLVGTSKVTMKTCVHPITERDKFPVGLLCVCLFACLLLILCVHNIVTVLSISAIIQNNMFMCIIKSKMLCRFQPHGYYLFSNGTSDWLTK